MKNNQLLFVIIPIIFFVSLTIFPTKFYVIVQSKCVYIYIFLEVSLKIDVLKLTSITTDGLKRFLFETNFSVDDNTENKNQHKIISIKF